MKKLWITIAIIFSVVGIVLMSVSAYGTYKYIKSAASLEEGIYEIDESINKLDIKLSAGQVKFVNSETSYIEYKVSSFSKIKFENNKLTIKNEGFFSWIVKDNNTVTVYLNHSQDYDLSVDLNAGKIDFVDTEFNSVNMNLNAGEINAKNLVATEDVTAQINAGKFNFTGHADEIKFDINAGSADLKIDIAKSNYVINCDVNVGSGKQNYNEGGTKKITGSVDVGSIMIDFV